MTVSDATETDDGTVKTFRVKTVETRDVEIAYLVSAKDEAEAREIIESGNFDLGDVVTEWEETLTSEDEVIQSIEEAERIPPLEGWEGEHGPTECGACHRADVKVCCSGASYKDGSHDEAVCVRCCPAHGRNR